MKRLLLATAALLSACGQDGGGSTATAESNAAASAPARAAKGEQPETNLLQALSGSADHKTLASAVQAAGLSQTLSGAQPYTLFAPTEAAFQKLSPGAANDLLAPEAKGRLVALISGHIVPGIVTSADLGRAIERGKGKAELATMGGGNLSFSRSGDTIVVAGPGGGQATVTGAERLASNGVVHSVDSVMSGR
ncbi:MAG TPA: fasciclin domain-containing protein [Allosphingosinicella sp.]|jgi:uncharacterized surface protein with fasciclin (FAS1) repeats